jgi:Ca-activated chloride channel homolog
MTFIWPLLLWSLLLIPALAVAYVLAQRRRQRYTLRYASLEIVKDVAGHGSRVRRHLPAVLFIVGLGGLLFALARPVASMALWSAESTVILALDVSGSMSADDVTPTRIDAAKAAAHEFVSKLPPTTRVGIVSFSDDASIVQTPTTDQAAVTAALDRLQPGGGTAIGQGLLVSLKAILEDPNGQTATPTPMPTTTGKGGHSSASIVLLTDGENNVDPDPLAVVNQLTAREIRVYTVGLGTQNGVVETPAGLLGTKIDETTLKRLADATGGQYFGAASTASDLRSIYQNLSTKSVARSEPTEVTAPISGMATLLLLIASVLSRMWFSLLP